MSTENKNKNTTTATMINSTYSDIQQKVEERIQLLDTNFADVIQNDDKQAKYLAKLKQALTKTKQDQS